MLQTQSPNATDEARSVRKRLFVFCDGTWQDSVNNTRPVTNVATLARCLEGVADDGYLQISYYDNGVGNRTSLPAHVIDGATGRGMSWLFMR
ncbi:putative peptigoglycan-binding protein [Rosellinia necatrix]|uniref:Putative peptigoglycan-binding protein n=1 Tax=Rosellinia necatrix TaxID=77044 RepID=A0A1S8AAE7_ROSNE|nr:putative peptigoglycan-binding protein [Rosellinia necatrix]